MCFLVSFFPATFWAVIGYLVLWSSTKAEGSVQTFGRGLAAWVFFLAALILIGGAYFTLSGLCSFEALTQCMNVAVQR